MLLFLELLGELLGQAASCPFSPGSEVGCGAWSSRAEAVGWGSQQDRVGWAGAKPFVPILPQATALPGGRPHVRFQ